MAKAKGNKRRGTISLGTKREFKVCKECGQNNNMNARVCVCGCTEFVDPSDVHDHDGEWNLLSVWWPDISSLTSRIREKIRNARTKQASPQQTRLAENVHASLKAVADSIKAGDAHMAAYHGVLAGVRYQLWIFQGDLKKKHALQHAGLFEKGRKTNAFTIQEKKELHDKCQAAFDATPDKKLMWRYRVAAKSLGMTVPKFRHWLKWSPDKSRKS